VLLGTLCPEVKTNADVFLQKAIFMAGRSELHEEMLINLNRIYKEEVREYMLVRGNSGSGKTLFIRRALYDFIERNSDLKKKL
jgi:hypothetical protein